jgi:hypothetical protein
MVTWSRSSACSRAARAKSDEAAAARAGDSLTRGTAHGVSSVMRCCKHDARSRSPELARSPNDTPSRATRSVSPGDGGPPPSTSLRSLPTPHNTSLVTELRNATTVAAQNSRSVRTSHVTPAVAPQPFANPNTSFQSTPPLATEVATCVEQGGGSCNMRCAVRPKLQYAPLHAAEMPRMGSQTPRSKNDERPAVQALTTECELVRTSEMPPEGLEPSTR